MKKLQNYWIVVLAVALGYFIDLYDILLFSSVRKISLLSIGVPENELTSIGIALQNWQLLGMLTGGISMGVFADKKGRLALLFVSIFTYSVANILNAYVQNINQYAILRFIAGLGLAGELGIGITLASEVVPKHMRTIATMFISSIGLLGGVAAAVATTKTDWQTAYLIGGGMGLCLLVFRFSISESLIFENLTKTSVVRGSIKQLFLNPRLLKKFTLCVFAGAPGLFFTAFYVTLAPEFGEQLGLKNVHTSEILFYYMFSLSFCDILANLLSKFIKSRKKTIYIFCFIQAIAILNLFLNKPQSLTDLIVGYVLLGASLGYWGVVVTFIAENWGSELRATATTGATNLIRALTIPGIAFYQLLSPEITKIGAGMAVGLLFVIISLIATSLLKDNFENSLEFNE